MSSTDVATNPNPGSDQKSDLNKQQQDQAGSGTDDSKQINGKNVIGKREVVFLFFLCVLLLPSHSTRLHQSNLASNSL